MTTPSKRKLIWGNIVFLSLTPAMALVLTPIYAYFHGIGWQEIIAAMTLWWLTGLGITAGYHRLFAHRAYRAPAPVRFVFAVFGAAAWQNSVITWCAAHRYHHRDVDTDGDPYNAKRGLLYSHIGWILQEGPRHKQLDNVEDLWADPICVWQHNHYLKISTAVNVGIPLALGLWLGNVWGMLLIAGLVRVVLVHHFTFTINSLAHKIGSRPWSESNTARDSWIISLISFGEGYHNYHHAFETDFRNGRDWYDWDPGKWLILFMERIGFANGLRRIPDHMVLRRRFEENKNRFSDHLDSLGQAWDTWTEEVASKASETQNAMAQHLVRAEAGIDTALKDLRTKQVAWQQAIKNKELSRQQLRKLRKTIKRAQRSLHTAIAEWEQLTVQYTLSMSAA